MNRTLNFYGPVNYTENNNNAIVVNIIGGQQHAGTGKQEPELTPCEIVPEAQEQQTEEEDPVEQPKAEPIRLTAKELNAMHLLMQAGLLNRNYQFYTSEDLTQNPCARMLTVGMKVMVAKLLGERFNQPHVMRYCKGFWLMEASNQTLTSTFYKFRTEQEKRALTFEQEIKNILKLMDKSK